MRITLRQLEIFSAIARSGSTTAAADAIALSQSAVSAAINELERILGARLFDRVGKRLLLNDQGRAMLPHALALLASIESLEQACQQDASSLLRIGASLTIGNYLLPGMLAAYWQSLGIDLAHGTPQLQVRIESTAEIAARVANFDVDIGLVEGTCHEPELRLIPWREDELLIVTAPGHVLAAEYGDRQVPAARLANASWLLREQGSGTRTLIEQVLLPQLKQLNSTLEFSDHEAIKHAAAAGLGIACLSSTAVEDMLHTGKLVVLNTPFTSLWRRFHILVHRQKLITPALQRLIDYLVATAHETP